MNSWKLQELLQPRKYLQFINQIVGEKFLLDTNTYPSPNKAEPGETREPSSQYSIYSLNTSKAGPKVPDDNQTFNTGFPVIFIRNTDPFRVHEKNALYHLKASYSYLVLLKSLRSHNVDRTFALTEMLCSLDYNNFPIQWLTKTECPVRFCFTIIVYKLSNSPIVAQQAHN